jgi:hypothetical protein
MTEAKTIFDYLNSINNKEYLPPDPNLKLYNQYVLNKGLSYYPDTIELVDLMNRQNISDGWHYEFLYHVIEKRVRKSKWYHGIL